MKNLQQEVATISGGSLGIGFSIARRLGRMGARISICGRRNDALQQARESLCAEGIDVLAVTADVAREDDVERWFSETEARFGSASILVNNAGISGHGPFTGLDESQWDETVGVNCRGPFLCTRRSIPAMKQAKRGRILYISSIAGQYYRKDFSLYFTSKWALMGFAHCAAKELNPFNIHVNIICPGMTETRFFDRLGGRPHPEEKNYVDPDRVADLVEHFCSLPEGVDTNEYSIFPSWQLKNLGIRR